MLHGFDATSGTEKLAYLPKGVMNNLPKLTEVGYGDNSSGSTKTHLYFVDGSPFAGDLKVGGGWRTYLTGTLGAGGKGYFILNVTNPTNFSAANASSIVIADNTFSQTDTTANPDLGNIFGEAYRDAAFPQRASQFSQLQSGSWALIMGNGYNSTNGNAKLVVHQLNGTVSYVPTDSSSNNGLSTPTPIDLNGDDKVDVVYAGDIQGNLWKFDFTAGIPSSGEKIFTTEGNRPITVAPDWIPHPLGGIMLGFGTGQNITLLDSSDKTTQYRLYGIRDKATINLNLTTGSITLGPASPFAGHGTLVSRSFESAGAGLRNLTGGTIDFTVKNGWYLDLPAGERSIKNPSLFTTSILLMPTNVPSSGSVTSGETCETSTTKGESWLNFVDLLTGGQPKFAVIDSNNDGVVNSSDTIYSGLKTDGDSTLVQIEKETGTILSIENTGSDTSSATGGNTIQNTTYSTGANIPRNSGWRQMQ